MLLLLLLFFFCSKNMDPLSASYVTINDSLIERKDSQSDEYLFNLSSETYAFEDKMTKY